MRLVPNHTLLTASHMFTLAVSIALFAYGVRTIRMLHRRQQKISFEILAIGMSMLTVAPATPIT